MTRFGLALLLGLLAMSALVARSALQRAEHQQLRAAEVGRAPVVGPRRVNPPALPAAPSGTSCLRGVVLDHGAPVSAMQVSVSDSPPAVSGDCPCARPAVFCGCREGLVVVPTLPRAGLIEAVQSTTSDERGRFELCGLAGDGRRLIWAEHADGRLAAPTPGQSPDAKPGAVVELQVLPLLPVHGVVLAEQTPVPGATVFAFATPALSVRTFVTDARGRFETRLLQGTSNFVVSAPGFTTQRLEEYFAPQQALVLRLRGESELNVRALFEERPVGGAEVVIAPQSPVLTDAQGLARFALPVDPRLVVRVTKGALMGTATTTLLPGVPRQLDVVLQRAVRASGTVTDEQGRPHTAKIRGLPSGKPLLADAAGHFASGLLQPFVDVYPVAFSEGCADSEFLELQVGAVDLTVPLKLACAESASGQVVDAEGKPIGGAGVLLDAGEHHEHAVADEAGRFHLHQPKGTYQLKVSHERYRSHQQPLAVPVEDLTVVLDAGGSISGRVVDGAGVGVVGAAVAVVPAVLDELLGELEGGNTRATTDAEGRFEVPGLLAGRLVVSATSDSQGTVVSDVVVLRPGEHREGLLLTLAQGVDLQGVVQDEQRRPIPGAKISWSPADEKSALLGVLLDAVRGRVDEALRFLPSPSVTDVDGQYALRGLPVSKVKLEVQAPGYTAAEQLAARGDSADFTLKREGGRVRGRAVDEAGRPLTRFAVNGLAFTPDDGRFEVDASRHQYTLSITAPGFTRQAAAVALEGSVKDVGDIMMRKGRRLRLQVRAPDGRPLEGVRVSARQEVDGDSCTTTVEGQCAVEPLLDVQTEVKASKDGYSPAAATVGPGQLDQPLTLTMSVAGGRLVGQAFALPGRGAPARSVFLSGAVSKSVMTDGEGRFTAEGLPEGPYCVSLDSSGALGLEWAVPAQASATPTGVQLGPVATGGVVVGARTLPGRLLLLSGTSGPREISEVVNATTSQLCGATTAPAIAATTVGDFRVEGVPPGRWAVFFVSLMQAEDKGTVQPTVIDLLPGETKSIP